MLRNKYIFAGTLCVTVLMQGFSSEALTVADQSCSQKYRLEDCFARQSLPMTGPSRCYVPFVADVELGKFEQSSTMSGSTYRPLKTIAGVAGIVEGKDTELTEEVAKAVKHLLTVCGIEGLPQTLKKHNKECLKMALRKVIAEDFDRLRRSFDIKLRVVWFWENSPSKYPMEFGELKRVGADLSKILLPACAMEQLKVIKRCFSTPYYTQEAQLSVLDKFVKTAQDAREETHEATVLRFDHDCYLQLLEQYKK